MNQKPQCPPCYGDCRQGRACNADPDPEDEFALWAGLRNAISIIASLAALVLGGCELVRRFAG